MTNSSSMTVMPGALELLVIAVIVGAIVLVIGPKKSRTALGVLAAVALVAGLLWFVAVPMGAHVAQVPGTTIRSSIGPMSVTIEGTSDSSSSGLTIPTPPSAGLSVPPGVSTPMPSVPEVPVMPSPETFRFAPGPLSATGDTRMKVAILPLLIILLAVVAGLVALFLRSRRTGRVVMGILAVPVFLFFGLFFFRFSANHNVTRGFQSIGEELRSDGVTLRDHASREATAIREDVRAKASAMREHATREAGRVREQIAKNSPSSNGSTAVTEWTPSEQHAFEADLYPSKQSAAVALARHSLNQCLTELMPEEILQAVHLSVSEDLNGAIQDRLVTQMTQQINLARAAAIKTLSPRTSLRVTVDSVQATATAPAEPAPVAPGVLTLRFVTTKDLPAEQSTDGAVGEIELTLRTQGGERVRTARFVNALWTEGFARWTQQGPGTWVLGESDQLWPTEDQARADAFQRAAEGVERHLRDYIARNGRYTPVSAFAERPGWLSNQITSELRNGQLVKTEFNQGFERPYGKVYRRAVLVRLPPEELRNLADRYFRHVDQVRDTWGRSLGSGLALLALVFVVYLVLNAATRGYYVWVMRTAAGVAAVIGVVFILMCVA